MLKVVDLPTDGRHGIAEQHAATSAAGLAYGGLHPVVAVYATFLNRAFDQVLANRGDCLVYEVGPVIDRYRAYAFWQVLVDNLQALRDGLRDELARGAGHEAGSHYGYLGPRDYGRFVVSCL